MRRPFTRALRILLAALFGALVGFVGWLAAGFFTAMVFMRQGNISQDEMGMAVGAMPNQTVLSVMVVIGALGGGFLGWRSGVRHKTLDDPL